MRTLTSADIQRYVRIVIYMIVGALGQRGIQVDGTWVDIALFAAGGAANFVWSVYGMRVNAKIAEMVKLAQISETPIAAVITTSTLEGRRLAQEIPGPIEARGTVAAEALVSR